MLGHRMKGEAAMWAHSKGGSGNWHPLEEHLRATGALARRFAEPFGAGDLAEALGLLHDAGKASCVWQDRLRVVAGTGKRVGVDHKKLGARLLRGVAGPAVLGILGHHGGLTSKTALDELDAEELGADDLVTTNRLIKALPEAQRIIDGPALVPEAWLRDPLVFEMGVRLTFSALVDADHLDTAAHSDGLDGPEVRPDADMAALFRCFAEERAKKLADRPSSALNRLREELYAAAIAAAAGPPGLYRLPAPTGSGKTMTAAGFALRHAALHGKSRVIVAVPFVTITEQNAQEYRDLLGEETVLEHHSAVESDKRRHRLGAENWDAPFVVTTTVQLFDSLFGRKPARSRKLHRLANAVIVLDEVQSLPIPLLVPILDGLRVLTEYFGTTVLLASATQPAFEHLEVWRSQQIPNIVDDPTTVYEQLRRVRYEWWLDPRPTLADVAAQVATERQALVVVNTVGDARTMVRELEQRTSTPVWHLSARMCPAHRRTVLAEVRKSLNDGESVLLVSTQLIEAGVDIDFPAVYRALAPADSLQQAAGRANREGQRPELGRCIVFDASDAGQPPVYRVPVDQTKLCFGPDRANPDNLGALSDYYRRLYEALNTDGGKRVNTIQKNRRELDFQSVADGPPYDVINPSARDSVLAFRMLDEETVPVVVTEYDTRAEELLDELRVTDGSRRRIYQDLQQFTVAMSAKLLERPDIAALCEPVFRDGDLREWRGHYHEKLGVDEGEIAKEMIF
jgi:CRISPR-associated endonuclease/helicase Cas3